MVPHIIVRVEVMGVRPGETLSLGSRTIEAAPGRPGRATIPIEFQMPGGERANSLEIVLESGAGQEAGSRMRVSTTLSVAAPSREGVRFERTREATVNEGSSLLHLAYENPERQCSVLLTLTPELREVPEVVAASAGAPVIFRVTLCRISKGKSIPIENNLLRTIEGSSVSYAFKTQAGRPSAPTDPPARQSGSDAPLPPAPADPGGAGAVPTEPQVEGPEEAPPERDEELELSLLPRRGTEGLLIVEATLSRRLGGVGAEDGGRAVLVRRTQVLTPGGVFELAVGDSGTGGEGGSRFEMRADF